MLVGVALLPAGPLDALANILISFTSAIQLESFRKFRGCAGSTTMCTGNLRSGTEQLYRFLALPDPQAWGKSSVYYRLILAFLAGAVVCGRLTLWWGTRTALSPACLCWRCSSCCSGRPKLKKRPLSVGKRALFDRSLSAGRAPCPGGS